MAVRIRSTALLLTAPLGLVMCSGSSTSVGNDGGALHAGSTGGAGSSGGGAPDTGAYSPTTAGDSGGADGLGGDASTGIDGNVGTPSDCGASDVGNTPLGTDTPDATGTAVDAITYTNVGVAGSYDKVVASTMAPTCVSNVCQKTPLNVSGPLVPFDEEMTMVFSGPMDLYQVAAYDPGTDGYQRVAYWDRCTTEGLAFVGNKAWYQCGGYVQSY